MIDPQIKVRLEFSNGDTFELSTLYFLFFRAQSSDYGGNDIDV